MASTGKRFALGCGGILVLMLFAGWAGFSFLQSKLGFTLDEAEVAARAVEMLPIQVPADFEPMFSLYTNDEEEAKDPLVMFGRERSRGDETLLLLHRQTAAFTPAEAFNRMNNSRRGMHPGNLAEASREAWTLPFRGQELMIVMEQGMSGEEALVRRLSTVLAWEDYHVLIYLEGPPTSVARDELATLLQTLPEGP
jgi:hypothetical protein